MAVPPLPEKLTADATVAMPFCTAGGITGGKGGNANEIDCEVLKVVESFVGLGMYVVLSVGVPTSDAEGHVVVVVGDSQDMLVVAVGEGDTSRAAVVVASRELLGVGDHPLGVDDLLDVGDCHVCESQLLDTDGEVDNVEVYERVLLSEGDATVPLSDPLPWPRGLPER